MKIRAALTTLYWNIAPVLPYLFIALLALSLGWKEVDPQTFYEFGQVVLGVPTIIVFILVPLQLLLPPDFSSWWYRRMVKKTRAQLARCGITPSQYLATLPPDSATQARAKIELGIE